MKKSYKNLNCSARWRRKTLPLPFGGMIEW